MADAGDAHRPRRTRHGLVDVAPLSQLAQDHFADVLNFIPDAKTLLIDPTLAGLLSLMVDLAALRQRGVEKMFWMEEVSVGLSPTRSVRIHAPTKQVLYLCRPEPRWMKTILAHYIADRDASGNDATLEFEYSVAFVPRRTEACVQFFRKHGCLQAINMFDLGLEFSVINPDVLSLEDPLAWRRLFLDGDHTPLFHAAHALMTLQRMWGVFPRIVGKGDLANRLCDLLLRQRREFLATDDEDGNARVRSNGTDPSMGTQVNPTRLHKPATDIDALVVLDRTVDLATPLLTQLTYEGLIDDVMGISSGFLNVDSSWVGAAQSAGSGASRRVRLDGNEDPLFESIRDDNFAIVGEKLHAAAKELSKDYEGRHQAQTVGELRAFVNRLGTLQSGHASLRLHTCITEHLLKTTSSERFHLLLEIQQHLVAGASLAPQLQAIDELIDLGVPMLDVLRVACLASYIHGGVKASWLDAFRTTMVHAYGFECLPQMMALERMRILYSSAATSSPSPTTARTSKWTHVLRPLRLIDDDVNERDPSDIGYVFSGYAPLSVRLVQTICQHEQTLRERQKRPHIYPKAARIAGWHGVDDAVLRWPGATFDFLPIKEAPTIPDDKVRTTVVFFVGGVTYAEIAALRLMSQQQQTRRFLIATTSITNGNDLLCNTKA